MALLHDIRALFSSFDMDLDDRCKYKCSCLEVAVLPRLFKRKKQTAPPYCAAVVVAAGLSTRMGKDKIMLPLREEPVIVHTLRALEYCPYIQEIVVVTREELIVPVGQLCHDYFYTKVAKVIVGGKDRTQSVRLGTLEVSDRAELIAIHDGARPLVPPEVLEEVILTAAKCSAAAPAVPVRDTIKRAVNDVVTETPDRSELFAVQTPQVFEAGLIRAALHQAVEEGAILTDDCAAVERLGMKVTLTCGSEENIKITTPADLTVAEVLMWQREQA